MAKSLAEQELQVTTEEKYGALLRSLRRRKGFGIFFVQCTPVGGQELIAKVRDDLPQKNIGVLKLDAPITNLIERVEKLPNQEQLNILFIVGLEKSLVEYIRPGYGGVGDYYKLDTVPPILNHLNWQRENFRDRFRNICFVFLLPPFALRYILLRAPDFADWRAGMVDVPTDRQLVERETDRLWVDGNFEKYRQWTPEQHLEHIAEIQTYLAKNPNLEQSAELWRDQGNILVFNQEYQEAIASYDKAVSIKPDYHEAWCNRGNALSNLGRYQEAIASYDKAVSIKPDNHEAWYNRGIALFNLGRYEEEIASYEEAVKIKPDYHEAWYNCGNALFNLGRYEEAIASYDKAVKIKPDKHEAWNNRGNALGNLGRYEEAIASYDKAVSIKPDKHEAWNNRGIALSNLGRYQEAVASCDKAVTIQPDEDEAWYNRGNALFNLGKYEEAVASYDKAVTIQPDEDEAWDIRGNALVNLGRYEEAIASYERALDINPNYPNAWYNKACTYALQDKIDLASKNLEKAIVLDNKYRNMAKEDSDFDPIRQDSRFQKLIEENSN